MKKLFVFLIAVLTLALMGCGGDAPKKDAAAPAGGDKQVLNLFSWADNFDPEVIAEFEKQNNCKVNYDVFANNEELLAKIQAGGAQYDLIQPSDYMVATMLKLNLLEELDLDKIPNAKNIVSSLKAPVYDPTSIPLFTPGALPASSKTKILSKKLPPHGKTCGTRIIKAA